MTQKYRGDRRALDRRLRELAMIWLREQHRVIARGCIVSTAICSNGPTRLSTNGCRPATVGVALASSLDFLQAPLKKSVSNVFSAGTRVKSRTSLRSWGMDEVDFWQHQLEAGHDGFT